MNEVKSKVIAMESVGIESRAWFHVPNMIASTETSLSAVGMAAAGAGLEQASILLHPEDGKCGDEMKNRMAESIERRMGKAKMNQKENTMTNCNQNDVYTPGSCRAFCCVMTSSCGVADKPGAGASAVFSVKSSFSDSCVNFRDIEIASYKLLAASCCKMTDGLNSAIKTCAGSVIKKGPVDVRELTWSFAGCEAFRWRRAECMISSGTNWMPSGENECKRCELQTQKNKG